MDEKTDLACKLIAIAGQLRLLFNNAHVSLTVTGELAEDISISYHGTRTYEEARTWFRSLGIQRQDKQVHESFTVLTGKLNGIEIKTYPDEIPPCCRKVEKIERVPKMETKETGEFIEIKRIVIECGPQSDGEKVEVIA